jgi:multimeric flavodoxin WrbA
VLNYRQDKPKKKILCIGASPRKGGNSDAILDSIQKGIARANIESNSILLRNFSISSCIGCERCRKEKECGGVDDDMQKIYPLIIQSSGLVLISPAHNYNVSALMKIFIDRLYRFYNFNNDHPRGWSSQLMDQNRKAVAVAIGEQLNKEDLGFTLNGMVWPLQALGYEVAAKEQIYGKFQRGIVKKDLSLMKYFEELGFKFAKLL